MKKYDYKITFDTFSHNTSMRNYLTTEGFDKITICVASLRHNLFRIMSIEDFEEAYVELYLTHPDSGEVQTYTQKIGTSTERMDFLKRLERIENILK